MLRNYLKNYKSDFSDAAQIGVFNCIQIIKTACNGDMSREDLSCLDLRRTPLNGVWFSRGEMKATFDGSKLSNNTLLPQGHEGLVKSAVYSADEKRILSSSSYDATIKEWDRETGECLRTFEGHEDWVMSVIYSADEEKILSGSRDGTIKEWDRETGMCLRTYVGHNNEVSAVFSHDDKCILSGCEDRTVKEWNRGTGECLRTYMGHKGSVKKVVCSPDGKRILSSDNENIKEWDRETGECIRTINGYLVGISSDAQRILFICDNNIVQKWNWDGEPNKCLQLFGENVFIHNAILNSDGNKILLVTGYRGHTISEWDKETGDCLREFICLARGATYSSDEKRVLAWGRESIQEWDLEKRICLRKFGWRINSVKIIEYSTDEQKVLTVSSDGFGYSSDGVIREWDRNTVMYSRIFEFQIARVCTAVFSLDRKRILSTSYGDAMAVEWDLETGECLHMQKTDDESLDSAIYSPDGNRILCISHTSSNHIIKEFDTETGDCTLELGVKYSIRSATYSPNGRKILLCYHDEIEEWDMETGKCRAFDAHNIRSAVYSPDGQKILLCYFDTIVEWDIDTGDAQTLVADDNDNILGAIYNQTKERMLSYLHDGTIKEWDLKTGKCLWASPPYGGVYIVGCSFKGCEFSSNELGELVAAYGGIC